MSPPEHAWSAEFSALSSTSEPYERCARFPSERLAYGVYNRVQEAIFRTPCDLSVFRFLLDRVSHVAVLGARPPAAFDRDLRTLLSAGEGIALPDQVQLQLWIRRLEANREAPWVERHSRPGHGR